jgi:hypothetical protein
MGTLDMDALDRSLAPPERWDGAARWEALGKLLTQPAWDKAADQWMERAERALEAWPDADRVWPHAWFKRKVAPRATRLVRTLRLGDQSAAGHSAIFAQLATLDAEATPRLSAVELAYGRYNIKKQPTNLIDAAQASILMAALERTGAPSVSIMGGDSAELWAALAGAPAMATVRRFECSLYKNPHMRRAEYDAGFEGLLASPHLSALRELQLYAYEANRWPRLSPRAMELLIAHHAHRLSALWLPPQPEAEVEALCAASWPALREARGFGVMTLEQLAQSMDNAPALERLELHNRLHGTLMAPGQPGALRTLVLSASQLDEAQLVSVLRDPRMAKITDLSLQLAPLGAAALDALDALPLKRLDIGNVKHWETLGALKGRRLEGIEILHIEISAMDQLLAIELPALSQLTITIRDPSAQDLDALERAPWFPQLTQLKLLTTHARYGVLARKNALEQEVNAREAR